MFKPLPENSPDPVKIVKFRDIQVFSEHDIIKTIAKENLILARAVCLKMGMNQLLIAARESSECAQK